MQQTPSCNRVTPFPFVTIEIEYITQATNITIKQNRKKTPFKHIKTTWIIYKPQFFIKPAEHEVDVMDNVKWSWEEPPRVEYWKIDIKARKLSTAAKVKDGLITYVSFTSLSASKF